MILKIGAAGALGIAALTMMGAIAQAAPQEINPANLLPRTYLPSE